MAKMCVPDGGVRRPLTSIPSKPGSTFTCEQSLRFLNSAFPHPGNRGQMGARGGDRPTSRTDISPQREQENKHTRTQARTQTQMNAVTTGNANANTNTSTKSSTIKNPNTNKHGATLEVTPPVVATDVGLLAARGPPRPARLS